MIHHIALGPFVKLYEIVLKSQQSKLQRRARAIADSLHSAATQYKIRVSLRGPLERWAANRLEGATVEGDVCVIWVNTAPATLQHAMMMRTLNTPQGYWY